MALTAASLAAVDGCSSTPAPGAAPDSGVDASPDQASPSVEAGTDSGTDSGDSATFPSCDKGPQLDAGQAPVPDAGLDSGDPDSGDGSTTTRPHHAKLQIVNASNKLASMRICFAFGQAADGSDARVSPLPALPHVARQPFPGTQRGTVEVLSDFTDLSQVVMTFYAIDASKIPNDTSASSAERTCDDLLKAGSGLTEEKDYFKFGIFPKGTFANGSTIAIAAYDCDPLVAAGPLACPAGKSMSGLAATLDRSPTDTSALGVQVAHLAPKLFDSAAQPSGLDAYFGCVPFAKGLAFGDVRPSPAAALRDLSSRFTFEAHTGRAGGPVRSNPMPLPQIQSLSPAMQLGANHTFFILGDPAAEPATLADGTSNPKFDGSGIHVIALQNDPELPKFQ